MMRVSRWLAVRLLRCLCLALVAACAALSAPAIVSGQTAQKPVPDQPKMAAAELAEARKVEAATDAQGRLTAAGEFFKKYPQSTLRPQLAQLVAQKIDEVIDPAQVLVLADSFRVIFNQPGEADMLNGNLLGAYLKANRFDDAFKLASTSLDKMANPVGAMIDLVLTANAQVRQQNTKFVPQGMQYAGRAIELIEANQKPAAVDDAMWAEYKSKWLPQLYQLHGFLLYASGDATTAQTRIAKAIALNPTEPFNYWLIGNIRNAMYQALVGKYKAATGPAQADMLKQAQAQLDQIIDDYAHVVALSEGNAQFQAIHDQAMQDVQSYYQYRHNGSADGLKQLIEKYKQPAAPKP